MIGWRLIFASIFVSSLACGVGSETLRARNETTSQQPSGALQLGLGADKSAMVQALSILQRRALTPDLRAAGAANFDRALADIAAKFSQDTAVRAAASEGQDVEAKLVAIAFDRVAQPAPYEELRRFYLEIPADSKHIAPGAPNLRSKHLAEDYRFAWEYFLLRPPAAGYPDRFEARVVEALAAIANPTSIPAFDAAIEATAQAEVQLDTSLALRQRRLLSGMTAFPTAQGAESLGHAVAAVKNVQVRAADPTVHSAVRQLMTFDPGAIVLRSIQAQPVRQEQWRNAFTEALSKPTTRSRAASEFLAKASEALRQASPQQQAPQ